MKNELKKFVYDFVYRVQEATQNEFNEEQANYYAFDYLDEIESIINLNR